MEYVRKIGPKYGWALALGLLSGILGTLKGTYRASKEWNNEYPEDTDVRPSNKAYAYDFRSQPGEVNLKVILYRPLLGDHKP